MRYVLAAIFASALAVPAASALPALAPNSASASKPDPILLAAKHGKSHAAAAHHHGHSAGSGSSGIHPLVGSGDY